MMAEDWEGEREKLSRNTGRNTPRRASLAPSTNIISTQYTVTMHFCNLDSVITSLRRHSPPCIPPA